MRGFLKFILWVLGLAAGAFLIAYFAFFRIWTIPAGNPLQAASLEPTMSAGDVVFVWRRGTPNRGDLARCTNPETPAKFVVGRAIAKEGETVAFSQEVVSLDGQRNPSPYGCAPPTRTMKDPVSGEEEQLQCSVEDLGGKKYEALRSLSPTPNNRPPQVPPGKLYLVSDNRHFHWDSRNYGPVDATTCRPIYFRLWGKDGFGDSKKRFSCLCTSAQVEAVEAPVGWAVPLAAVALVLTWRRRRKRVPGKSGAAGSEIW